MRRVHAFFAIFLLSGCCKRLSSKEKQKKIGIVGKAGIIDGFCKRTALVINKLRNIAIIAHVDHGKTTLVDELLKQSGTLGERFGAVERVMDSNDQEKERGITILSKNTAINWNGYRINIVDTPGHADFGGEVERVLSMVDSVLLLVDAQEGPMPQTRFVTQKAFDHGLRPILVVNKIDKPGARPEWVIDQVFELFDRLGASDEQLDFPIVYASAINGYAGLEDTVREGDMSSLFEAIIEHCPVPDVDPNGPLQMQISNLDYNSYVGAIAVGRITRGTIRPNQQVVVVKYDGEVHKAKVGIVYGYLGLERHEVKEASAGDIIAITGMEAPNVSDTLCDPENVEALPALSVDEPTVSMTFQVNASPFAGKEGKYLTSRQLKERLERELIHNVALRVEEGTDPEKFKVSGRGELHLSVLLENMRREGFELAVSRPEVIFREIDGEVCEPYEQLTVDVEEQHQGAIMEALGARKGELKDMVPDGKGRVRLDYVIPSRGLIGFQTEFMTSTSGTGLMYHVFDHYGEAQHGGIAPRKNGVLISNGQGKVLGFALFNLQERGKMFASPGDQVYEGQIVGIHSRDNDLVVNPLKGKQLTNVRASGKDDAIMLTPPLKFSLEQALEFIEDDELVELTPSAVRIRKKHLKEHERKRASREG
ncbi:GTP-binding protein TypA/BipA [endosymbiont of Riftia pachyptila (vent Ph05)]|uniref:Large ribosomal subunit assembly factor BipA n=1 Tax=endosymbiont of Riftia pachyptila (vent Ph05) TaxID=1048808 RepID=G2DFF0_9GAMM|nr:GTP-binding protein TypA/BipA [endosymbiont of Riftia pachyptila (vent Ph05)]